MNLSVSHSRNPTVEQWYDRERDTINLPASSALCNSWDGQKIDHDHMIELRALCKMMSHVNSINNMLPLTHVLHSSKIPEFSSLNIQFDRVYFEEKVDHLIFSNEENDIAQISPDKLAPWCVHYLKHAMKSSAHLAIPSLWNSGDIINKNNRGNITPETINAHLFLLHLKNGGCKTYQKFSIRKHTTEEAFHFFYGQKVLTLRLTNQGEHEIASRDKSFKPGSIFDTDCILSAMLFLIRNMMLLRYKHGSWSSAGSSPLKKAGIMVSYTFVIPSIRLISNMSEYTVDEGRDLRIWSFDQPSMELYQSCYIAFKEALPQLVDIAISQFPRIGGSFVGIYKYMYGGYDPFLTDHEISFYKTLGKILHVCICHNIPIGTLFTDYMTKGLLIFHINELIDVNSMTDPLTRSKVCRRLFEVHRYDQFRCKGVWEILHDDMDTFKQIDDNEFDRIINAFFILSDWWKYMRLSTGMSYIKDFLIANHWSSMKESIKLAICKEYDQFIDPMYNITRSFTSVTLINEKVPSIPNNLIKYKDSLKMLDKKLSNIPFPIIDFLTAANKIHSMLVWKTPKSLELRAATSSTRKKTDWLKHALLADSRLSYDLWKFASPMNTTDPIVVHMAPDIGRLLYSSPCDNTIYVSDKFYTFDYHQQRWCDISECNEAKDESTLVQEFVQSVKDSFAWHSGLPEALNALAKDKHLV